MAKRLIRWLVQLFFLIMGGALGVLFFPYVFKVLHVNDVKFINHSYVMAGLGALILFILTFWLVDYIVDVIHRVEEKLIKMPIADILFGSLSLMVGLLLSYLVTIPLRLVSFPIMEIIVPIFSVFLTILIGYLSLIVGFRKRVELMNLFFNRKKKGQEEPEITVIKKSVKVLDTSVIIDGRIADICQTGFLEGTIVIPRFVLGELQHIADSSDALKRTRGRRGLDILNRIQKELEIQVEISEIDFPDIHEVDSKLVKVAKEMSGILVTNDFNLNKVCELQQVPVLNINDLANAVKPVVLPGEELNIQIVKDGKEHHQGIAYLDDGTMIVIEDGRDHIGKHADVVITSVLQTSAGRMIFAKLKSLEKAL